MTFKILTAVVFIAEIIIAYTVFTKLLALDKLIIETSETVIAMKPGIKDVGYLLKKISAQCVELSKEFVSEIIKKRDESVIRHLNKIVITVLLLRLNSKFIYKVIRSKHFKRLCKGLSILKYMV